MKKYNKTHIYPNRGYEDYLEWNTLAANIEEYLHNSKIVKDEKHLKAGICSLDNKKLFIKKYINNSFAFKLKGLFRVTKAKKNCYISNCLENSNVNFPKIYGYITSGRVFSGGNIYLIMEAIENIASDDFYRDYTYKNKDNLSKYLESVVLQIYDLHKKNIIHRDCKQNNFYLFGAKESYKVGMLDFDGSKSYRRLTDKQRARDLSRFAAAVIENFYRPGFEKLCSNNDLVKYIIGIYNISENKYLEDALNKKLKYHLKRKNL